MKLKVRRLQNTVPIHGKPLFGFYDADVTVGPAQDDYPLSWMFMGKKTRTRIDASTTCVSRMHNLAIRPREGRTALHVLEHLSPLRILGLLGATIESTSRCLPYFGSMSTFVDKILPACEELCMDVPVKTVDGSIRWTYPNKGRGMGAFTEISPRKDGRLVLDITVNYRGLGYAQKIYEFPDDVLVERVARTGSQGWPRYRYPLSCATSRIWLKGHQLWKHHNEIAWPKLLGPGTLDQFIDHRCLDLLGALALLMDGCFFSANVRSVCSGHKGDLGACQIASQHLVPIS